MDFMMNEVFIQVMDKFNEELQVHVDLKLCHSDIFNCRKFMMHQMV
jgi:hypothetical protein